MIIFPIYYLQVRTLLIIVYGLYYYLYLLWFNLLLIYHETVSSTNITAITAISSVDLSVSTIVEKKKHLAEIYNLEFSTACQFPSPEKLLRLASTQWYDSKYFSYHVSKSSSYVCSKIAVYSTRIRWMIHSHGWRTCWEKNFTRNRLHSIRFSPRTHSMGCMI
jgi:hypothetical protein